MRSSEAVQQVQSRQASGESRIRQRLLFIAPVATFLLVALALAWGMTRDPRLVPSPLIGSSVPEFALPPVQGRSLGLSSSDLQGEVSLVNVFASWCVSCRLEHPVFMKLQEEGIVPIHGINYKDRPEDADEWLDVHGDPYTRTGADLDGRVAIEWGVYGVPETFVIDHEGRIAYKHIGPLLPEVYRDKIAPLLQELRDKQRRANASNSQ